MKDPAPSLASSASPPIQEGGGVPGKGRVWAARSAFAGRTTVFPVVFGWSGTAIVEKFSALLSCPFLHPLATESRFFFLFFLCLCLLVVAFLGCWLP